MVWNGGKMMNIKEGLKRIYIVISVFWFLFCLFVGMADKHIGTILAGIFLPIIIYFILVYIVQGFIGKDKE